MLHKIVVVLLLLTLASWARGAVECAQCPICDRPWGFWKVTHAWVCRWGRAELPKSEVQTAKRCLKDMLQDSVVGQKDATERVLRLMVEKLDHPARRLVMHFAGDNGVGKSLVANTISLAVSLRQAGGAGDEGQGHGNAMRVLSAPGLAAMDVAASRTAIVAQVTQHLRRHPHGIILIDDAQALSPDHFKLLAPLLGSGDSFPDAPDVRLDTCTVILISDFGKEGRTRALAPSEIEAAVHDDMSRAYEHADTKLMKTIVFLPLGGQDALAIVKRVVERTPCRDPRVLTATIDDDAALILVRELNERDYIRTRNARAVADRVFEVVDGGLSLYFVDVGQDTRVRLHVRLTSDGEVSLRVSPEDALSPSVDL
jgi:ATP-dependent Clp protease ATP-binding subunit ClpA